MTETTFYVTTAEAAKMLEVTPATVCRMAQDGRLPIAYRIQQGSYVAYKYKRADVVEWACDKGLPERCVDCGLMEQTHPIETCGTFNGNWRIPGRVQRRH